MIVTPVLDHGIDFLASDLVRSPGVHASDLYGSLYARLEPKRYDFRDEKGNKVAPNPVLMALGTAWEVHLEYLLLKSGFKVERPGEFFSPPPASVAFSPDLLQENGVTRLWELKLTSMSAKDLPTEETNSLPPKFDKYMCVCPEVTLLTSDLQRIRADEVYEGLSLLAFDEMPVTAKRKMRHTVVTGVKRISKPCSRLYLADGSTVDVSNDHQWFAKPSRTLNEQWMPTDTLLQADKTWPGRPRTSNAFLARVFAKTWTSALTENEQGWLAGLADGEGCLFSHAKSGCLKLTISQNQGVVLNRLVDLLVKDSFGFTLSGEKCVSVNISNKEDVFRFLSVVRPVRLLQKFISLEMMPGLTTQSIQVLKRTDLGAQWVYAIETDAATYIADGLASHNCQMKLYARWLGLYHGALAVVFLYKPFDPQFRLFHLEWNDQELQENESMIMNHANHEGLLR